MCVMKTHSEKVTKSIWNYVEMYAKESRGIGMEDIGIKTYIHWNRPPLNLTESLGFKTMNQVFKGSQLNFVTLYNMYQSKVVTRHMKNDPPLVWF